MNEILDKMNRNAKVICADGFEMSVQANKGAYCTPRMNNADKYKEVTNVIARHGGMVEGDVPPGVIPLRSSAR